MMQRTIRYCTIAAIVIPISAVYYGAAQAQSRRAAAIACGQELKKQCGGVPVRANNMLECLQGSQANLPAKCVVLAHHIVRSCERDAAQHCQAVAAGQGNILGCLTTARRMVSSRCNAALDAAYLRQ